MKLPLLVSVPHAGERVPPQVADYFILSQEDLVADSDAGAAEIYSISEQVETFVTTDIARAIVDLNRAEDDRRADGVVKTHTCWGKQVYEPFPPEEILEELLADYHRPYHRRLADGAGGRVRLGLDCHTMAAHGPPVGPDPNQRRPWICLSHAQGTCPEDWFHKLASSLEDAFNCPVSLNEPFQGGFIIRSHAAELPWVQLELSREAFLRNADKRECLIEALQGFCSSL